MGGVGLVPLPRLPVVMRLPLVVPEPVRFVVDIDVDGVLTLSFHDSRQADRAYRGQYHRLLADRYGAVAARIRLDGQPFGMPLQLR